MVLLHMLSHLVGFNIEGMARLKYNVNDSIRFEQIYHTAYFGKTSRIWSHTGTGYLKISLSKRPHRVLRTLFNVQHEGLVAGTSLKCNDDSSYLLNDV
jgi:hypothetical protein